MFSIYLHTVIEILKKSIIIKIYKNISVGIRDRILLLFRRLFVLFILVSLVGFIVFLAVQSYENGKKTQNEVDR